MCSLGGQVDAGNGSGNGAIDGSQGRRWAGFEGENMFERYTEKARRVIFFARYEASKLGSRVIESEHILLGVLREGEEIIKEIFSRFNVKPEQIRREVEGDRLFVDRISSSAELPLSEESKKILAYAAHEAESMLHQYVGTEHLLIGILRVESSTAARRRSRS